MGRLLPYIPFQPGSPLVKRLNKTGFSMVPMTGNEALHPIAQEAHERIDRALARLKA